MTVSRARQKAGKHTPRTRREIARGVVVELPERTAGGWSIRTYNPLYGPIYVGRHRAERRAKQRAEHVAKHREWR